MADGGFLHAKFSIPPYFPASFPRLWLWLFMVPEFTWFVAQSLPVRAVGAVRGKMDRAAA